MGTLYCAERLVGEVRAGVSSDTNPLELTNQQVVRLHELLHAARFAEPKVCVQKLLQIS